MNKKLTKIARIAALLALVGTAACREEEGVIPSQENEAAEMAAPHSQYSGLYLLNEGNMGSNKCTLDLLDYQTGSYLRNIYPERNPSALKELGDVGNDLAIYGSRLYAVINCSNKVEVMQAATTRRIGQVDLPNCRYIVFHGGCAYVSCYVGGVKIDPNAPLGMVCRIDTATLQVTGECTVGYQPERMAVVGNRLYVANSGGYRVPCYDNSVSVIDLDSFTELYKCEVGINLHHIAADSRGRLWVSSRGDYEGEGANLYLLQERDGLMQATDTLDIPCTNFCIAGDSLYYFAAEWDSRAQRNRVSYGLLHLATLQKLNDGFIADGTQEQITIPYGLFVHPESGDIYVTDAKNYVSSGTLYCFTRQGMLRWKTATGDIPSQMALIKK